MFADDVHFDFAAALLVLALLTGIGAAVDRWVFAARREGNGKRPAVLEFSVSFFPVILIVLVLRSFIIEPFRIPSGSMIPTLMVGDFIVVNKFTYGLRMPVFHNVLLEWGEPERGDVMVFRWPVDPSKDFIKRVIGLPGDVIEYRDKTLYINGDVAGQEVTGYYTADAAGNAVIAEEYDEALGAVHHRIIVNPHRPANAQRFEVPEGHYFVMGDNRDGSDDSRRWGFVPERNLVGKAFMIWMSWDGERNWPAFGRIGTMIQ